MQKSDGDLEPSRELTEEAGGREGESHGSSEDNGQSLCVLEVFFFSFYVIKHKDQPFEQ